MKISIEQALLRPVLLSVWYLIEHNPNRGVVIDFQQNFLPLQTATDTRRWASHAEPVAHIMTLIRVVVRLLGDGYVCQILPTTKSWSCPPVVVAASPKAFIHHFLQFKKQTTHFSLYVYAFRSLCDRIYTFKNLFFYYYWIYLTIWFNSIIYWIASSLGYFYSLNWKWWF